MARVGWTPFSFLVGPGLDAEDQKYFLQKLFKKSPIKTKNTCSHKAGVIEYSHYFAIFICAFFSATYAHANCTSPAGVAGQFQYISSDYKYCDGTTWQTMTISISSTICVPGAAGSLQKSGSAMWFCNGSRFVSVDGAVLGSCVGTTTGTIMWASSDSRLEWCDGANWIVLGPLGPPPDPCDGKSIGEACDGTTALYAGAFDGGGYMIMPSGCADDTTDPTCSGGTDTVTKTWNNGSMTKYVDIVGITNITNAATPSPSSERGDITTPLIVAITDPNQGGLHAAARFCDQMVYGGYDDWYLPSKSELAYIYCKSAPGFHNVSWPEENVDCGGSGPSHELTGFVMSGGWYSTSTEYNAGNAWLVGMPNGHENGVLAKAQVAYVRCLRRYASDITPDAMDWADFDDTSSAQTLTGIAAALDLQISAVNNTGTPTLEFRVNSGAWTSFTAGTPRTVPMKLNDTLQFRVTGTNTHSATITIKNQSGGGTVLDTVMGTVTDPCGGKNIGEACNGTGALYLGLYEGSKYMIMPSGCADDRSEPSCSGGTDTVSKPWNDGTSNWYDIPGITNIANAADPSATSERGDYTTPLIATISDGLQGGEHKAGRYCNEMDYGGYTDWYLPSKSELAYIYCKSTPSSHSTSYPPENVNCGGSGPTNDLTGFIDNYYWSSTESGDETAWNQRFGNGTQYDDSKNNFRYIRCVRRY